MNAYNLGLVSVSFRKHTPEEILGAVKSAGLTCIEWGSDVHAPCKDTDRLQKIAALQKEYGITCSSYGTYFRIGTTPVEELETYISAAKILGTDILRLWCGDKGSQEYTDAEKETLFATCRALAEIAEKYDVTLCLECHNNTFTDRAEAALSLMQAVGSPHFKMYWQPNQYCAEEENLQYAAAIAPYTVNIHVFNWKQNERFPLSQAKTCWQGYLRQFDRSQILLLEFMPDDRIDSLPAEANALKEIAK